MSWLFLAILVRFFWEAANIIDQYLVRHFGQNFVLSVIILQSLMILPSIGVMVLFLGVPDNPGTVSYLSSCNSLCNTPMTIIWGNKRLKH